MRAAGIIVLFALLILPGCPESNSPSLVTDGLFGDVSDITAIPDGYHEADHAVPLDVMTGPESDSVDDSGDAEVDAGADAVELLDLSGAECETYVDCEDDNPCTFDFCDATFQCVHKPVEGECADDDPCTLDEMCVDGECVVGTVLECDDANPCTKDICKADGCYHGNLEGSCDDGDPCSLNDYCKLGTCVGGAQTLTCDDKNPCTTDSCAAGVGCQFDHNFAPCDDADPCTEQDQCAKGECGGQPLNCDDGDGCTVDSCSEGECFNEPNPGIDCNDNNPCTADSCNPATGDCQHLPVPGDCDDGDLCTTEDVCVDGVCSGAAKDCDDDNPCTDNLCDVDSGNCLNPAIEGDCDDGNLCTVGDLCADGICQPGGQYPDCDDGNSCTGATCDPKVGCVNDPLWGWPCDDGDPCTAEDTCTLEAVCVGEAIVCDDGDPCTNDVCNPGQGGCAHTPAPGTPCDDGDICTKKDTCKGNGTCQGQPKACDDLNPCTADSCDPAIGCVNTPIDPCNG